MTDDREVFKVRREAGLQKRHEKRLESATYTAAEVKVLTEAAAKFGYEMGRKEATCTCPVISDVDDECPQHGRDA